MFDEHMLTVEIVAMSSARTTVHSTHFVIFCKQNTFQSNVREESLKSLVIKRNNK